MPKSPPEVMTERLQEHPALQAWSQVHSHPLMPASIEVLKHKRKSAVYRLNGAGLDGAAIIAKRCPHATGLVEHLIYTALLPCIPVRPLRCHGFVREADEEFCWLFLDDAREACYVPQRGEHRTLAGAWLGEVHLATIPAEVTARLSDREHGYYLRLLHRCKGTLLEHMARTRLSAEHSTVFCELVTFCEKLESEWHRIETICAVMPQTLVHGDFVAKNVRIDESASFGALMVFDWQYAGWGVPAADLAQTIDKVVSPDLAVYHSVLRRAHPRLDLVDIQRVAGCGRVLRLLDMIGWAVLGLRFGDPRASSRAVSDLEVYQARMPQPGRLVEMALS
ncbi:MAG TPA: phosphotransferase [Vicinamibacterales bacterium]|jgi:hypothetical protein